MALVNVEISKYLTGFGPSTLAGLRKEPHSVRLLEVVLADNLSWLPGPGPPMFRGLPNAAEIAVELQMEEPEARLRANIQCCAQRLALISIEEHQLPVSRKTEVYVATEPTLLHSLTEHCQAALGEEYTRRFHAHLKLAVVVSDVRAHLQQFEGLDIGRLYRLLEGLNVLRAASLAHLSSAAHKQELEEEAIRLALSSRPVESKPTAGTMRRAEDSDEWKALAEPGGHSDWPSVYARLGPVVTSRILLRREDFGTIREWLRTGAHTAAHLGLVLADAHVTRAALQARGRTGEQLVQLESLIEALENRLYRR